MSDDPNRGAQPLPPQQRPPGPQPNTPPGNPSAVPAAPPAAPPQQLGQPYDPLQQQPQQQPPQGQPFAVFHTQEQFNDRVGRAARSQLRDALGMDPDKAKEALQRLATIESENEKKKQAEMSELERERAARVAAEAKAAAAAAEAEAAALDTHILQLCTERGIKDWHYAKFRIMGELEKLPDGQQLDEIAYLDKLIADPAARAALGMAGAPAAPPVQQQGANTSPAQGGPPGTPGAPPQQQPPNAQPPTKTAFELTPDEWARKKAALGLG